MATCVAAVSGPFVQLDSGSKSQFGTIKSKDETPIAVECAGVGPNLLIVHGGMGDHTQWKPLFPLLASRFTVCAMDRRGHGASGDSLEYALQREAEDVAAVVNSRPDKIFVLGHSYGAVCALEAAFLTNKISKLVLYEPPLMESIDLAVVSRMEEMIKHGDREQALVTFLQEIVTISPSEVAAMKARSSWPSLVVSIPSSIRQVRALADYRFDWKRLEMLSTPTLLLGGSESAAHFRRAIDALRHSLPHSSLVIFKGQQHNAMDNVPQQFSEVVTRFLLGTEGTSTERD